MVVRLFIEGEDRERISSKLEAIGFGFLIPIFFIESGITFDLHALIHKPKVLLLVPLFALLFLFTRGLPTWAFFRGVVAKGEVAGLAIMSATGLPAHRGHHDARRRRAPDEAAERGGPRRGRHAVRARLSDRRSAPDAPGRGRRRESPAGPNPPPNPDPAPERD